MMNKKAYLLVGLLLVGLFASLAGVTQAQTPNPTATPDTTAQELFQKGAAFLSTGDYASAVDSFSKAVEADPTLGEGYLGIAYAYNQLEQYDNALTAANQAIEIEPNLAQA